MLKHLSQHSVWGALLWQHIPSVTTKSTSSTLNTIWYPPVRVAASPCAQAFGFRTIGPGFPASGWLSDDNLHTPLLSVSPWFLSRYQLAHFLFISKINSQKEKDVSWMIFDPAGPHLTVPVSPCVEVLGQASSSVLSHMAKGWCGQNTAKPGWAMPWGASLLGGYDHSSVLSQEWCVWSFPWSMCLVPSPVL